MTRRLLATVMTFLLFTACSSDHETSAGDSTTGGAGGGAAPQAGEAGVAGGTEAGLGGATGTGGREVVEAGEGGSFQAGAGGSATETGAGGPSVGGEAGATAEVGTGGASAGSGGQGGGTGTVLCTTNQHVSSHVCVSCVEGSTRPAGDDATGADTACTEICQHGGKWVDLGGGDSSCICPAGTWGAFCERTSAQVSVYSASLTR
jgi:hypothetical protein